MAKDHIRPDRQDTSDDAQDRSQVGRGKKNVSSEPLPDLSEQGGIEPLQERPEDYHDRTRDRELDEG
jgi:hypothetical protein